jgi:adenosine deaminase
MRRRFFTGLVGAGTFDCAIRAIVGGQVAHAQDVLQLQRDWLERLPKVELHFHIEGAIPKRALWELITKYGGDPSVPTREDLERKFVYRDFGQFLQTWVWTNGFIREYEDYASIARAVATDLARQNIRYVEAFYSPPDLRRSKLTPQRITEAIRSGLSGVTGTEVSLIVDLVRDRGVDHARQLLERISEVRGQGVIGVGIGGSEAQFPPELFGPVYEQARKLGFHTTAHAGEAAGSPSVWGAIRTLRVDRIGHATRAVEDPDLVRYIAENRIPLELCPLSNVRTGIIDSPRAHPVRRYFDLGIPISLNTDDPLFFGNSLVDELAVAQQYHGFNRQEIKRVILGSINSSWLSAERKARLSDTFRRETSWNEV